MVFVVLGCTLFARFGINLGAYTLSFALVGAYLLLPVAWMTRQLKVHVPSLLVYLAAVAVGVCSLVAAFNFDDNNRATASSLALLAAIYAPLIFRHQGARSAAVGQRVRATFLAVSVTCAVAGLLQYLLQRVIHAPWLFDFSEYIPPVLRATDGFNLAIRTDEGAHKANGFFLREPSAFSFLMAINILIEMTGRRRLPFLALFSFCLLLSYSGTGILALAIGLAFALNLKSILRAVLVGGALLLVYLATGDVLNLAFTVGRVHEFSSEHSSAFFRYVAPMRLVVETIADTPWSALVGHGPGSIARTAMDFQFFDPTWAKLLFEYGLPGFGLMLALMTMTCRAMPWPLSCKVVFMASWLVMGGNLLAPGSVMLLWIFAFTAREGA